jgi:K+-sensing histidine kinase KdpD
MQTDTSFSEKHQRHLAIVHQSGKHLLNLVNNILTMTRIEAGNVSLHETQFDLFHLLESLQQIWQGRAIAKRLAFTVEWGPEVPQYIRSDESKLRQILMNLLENAIRFTTEGEVVLRVWGEGKIGNRWHTANAATAASNVPRPYLLQFEVSDTGPCIAPSEIGRLFEAFSQPASEPKSAQGIGLGLPISRQFVQLMGGEMYVRSRPGQGTSFSFDIKVQLVEPAVTDPAIAAQPSHEAGLPEAIAISYLVPPPLTAEQLRAAMPSDWIDHLHQAALRGSDQAILDLIQAIPAKQTDLAEALLIWTDTFRFDEIIQLTQQLIK